MENAFAVDVLNRFEQLVHVGFDFVVMEVLIPYETLVKVLLHQLED